MIRLTSGTGPVQVAGNDETIVVTCHDLVRLFCAHCGGLKNGILIYTPGVQMQEYDIKRALLEQEKRCACGQEASK